LIFLVKHVRHRSFFELATVKRKKQAKKALVFRVFQAPESKLEVNEERETSAFFPVARVSRSTPAPAVLRSPEKREKASVRLENKHLSLL